MKKIYGIALIIMGIAVLFKLFSHSFSAQISTFSHFSPVFVKVAFLFVALFLIYGGGKKLL